MDEKEFSASLLKRLHGYFAPAFRTLEARVAGLQKRLDDLPVPKDGADGVAGQDGAPGREGADGKDGIDGKDGTPGERGEKGEPGAPGTAGDIGPTGERGEKGDKGEKGEQGERGEPGKDGEPGPAGLPGQPGAKGLDGAAGRDGEPGRDAAHLEILPGIDQQRSYVRGTYAKHAGGLWRSFETTTGMKGWECIVEGIAHFSIEQQPENPRKFFMNLATSSGAEQVREFNLPVVLYRGIFKEGDAYEAGDSVTWGGSTWIALQDTKSKPDSVDGTWRLAVKKGAPGKDGGPAK